ncbi:hypothetical protein Q3G72_028751 [Acer saccharum]|nr:hypothetical protein Q3G72_028751 [Acer saccharum]
MVWGCFDVGAVFLGVFEARWWSGSLFRALADSFCFSRVVLCFLGVVIKVPVHSQKCRSKAMQIAVSASGVESSAFSKGDDKDQIGVTRDGIAVAKLTKLLRKKFGYAILESVSAATSDGEGGDEKEQNENDHAMEKNFVGVIGCCIVCWDSSNDSVHGVCDTDKSREADLWKRSCNYSGGTTVCDCVCCYALLCTINGLCCGCYCICLRNPRSSYRSCLGHVSTVELSGFSGFCCWIGFK